MAAFSHPPAEASQPEKEEPADGTVSRETAAYRLRRGDTLFKLFLRSGIGRPEQSLWLKEIAKNLQTRKLRADSLVVFHLDRKKNALRAVQIERSPGKLSTWERVDKNIVYRGTRGARGARGAKDTAVREKGVSGNDAPETPSPVHIAHVVRKGETFAGIVKPHGIFGSESRSWFLSLTKHHPKKFLSPGETLHLYFVYPPAKNRAGNLRALQVEIPSGPTLTWNREHEQIVFGDKRETAQRPTPRPGTDANVQAVPSSEPLATAQRVEHRLRSGDTLFEIMGSIGLSGGDAKRWSNAVNRQYRTNRLRVGRKIVFYLVSEAAAAHAAGKGRLHALQIESSQGRFLTWTQQGQHIAYRGQQKGPVAVNSTVQKWLRESHPLPRRRSPAAAAPVKTPEAMPNAQALHRVMIKVHKGDTFGGLLKPLGVFGNESQLWYRALREHRATRVLRPGQKLHLHFFYPPGPERADNLRMLQVESEGGKTLSWHREGDEVFYGAREVVRVARNRKPSLSQYSFARLRQRNTLWEKAPSPDKSNATDYDVEIKAVTGEISKSLYETAMRVGLHPQAVSQIVDIFGWDINFQTDLREGDVFRVLYRREFHPADFKRDRVHVLAAELVNGAHKHVAIYFENAEGQGNYYDLEGRSLSRSFLRYPLEFSRITSTVSRRRYHPILRVRRPHTGIDLAAPRGTPVRAVGSGVVTHAGWKGAYGRLIEIDHGGGIKTRYAHLRRFPLGIRVGAAVHKGQVIASVGCSGRCTGPHLHFEMWRNDEYINPLRVRFSPEDEIEPALLVIFENAKKSFLTKLSASPHS